MSMECIPKSYAVLMGLEGYSKGMENIQKIKKALRLEKGGDDGSGAEGKREETKGKEKEDEGGGIDSRSEVIGSGIEQRRDNREKGDNSV